MQLKEFLSKQPHGACILLAEMLEITPIRLSQHANGFRKISREMAVKLEKYTLKNVTRQDCFPDDYHIHWPELKRKQKKVVEEF